MHMYTYMCVYVYAYIQLHTYLSIYIYIQLAICVSSYMNTYLYITKYIITVHLLMYMYLYLHIYDIMCVMFYRASCVVCCIRLPGSFAIASAVHGAIEVCQLALAFTLPVAPLALPRALGEEGLRG